MSPADSPHPLVVTADSALLDELLRLAAVAEVDLRVEPDPAAARLPYESAPLVLVGLDQAQACHRAGLPRRAGVVMIGRAGDATPPWACAETLGAAHVAMLPAAGRWLVDRFTELTSASLGPAPLLAVIGGRGGAGASVLAAGIAVTAARAGKRTLLIDADPLGGGIDLVLGWEGVSGLRWPGLRDSSGPLRAPALEKALPRRGELLLLSWDRGDQVSVPPEAMAAAVEAGRRGRDLVVVDLPRRLDDAARNALRVADRTLLVVPAEVRATAAAGRVAAAVAPLCRSLAVVVRGPTPGKLTGQEVADMLQLPLAGCLRPEPQLARDLERGDAPAASGRGPLARLCRELLHDLGEQGGGTDQARPVRSAQRDEVPA